MDKLEPTIIIGMHRSGTSMVTRMLEELGLFVGERKMQDHEPYFFLGLNDWALRQCGGAWDHPAPFREVLENARVRALVVDYLRTSLRMPRAASYLGWKNYRRYRSPENLNVPWGWKDPRNTYTLPLWLEIFPEARVIHILRHGVDVAGSLKMRAERTLERAEALHERRKPWMYAIRPKRGGFGSSVRCATLEGGFTLWESYVEEARLQIERLGDRAMEFRYEDFLADPRQALSSLATFCSLDATREAIAGATQNVRRDRAYAYRDDPELLEFADQMPCRLKALGY